MKKVLSLVAVLIFLAFPIHATVTDTESPVKVYTSATVTAYPIPFEYIDDEDIEVKLVNIATGAETSQVLDVDYTIVSNTVTYATAPGSAYKVVIRRVTPYTQESSWVAGSAPPLSAWESAFDKITYLTQDLNERLSRALIMPEGAQYKNLLLPDPAYNAGKWLKVNAAGTKYEAGDLASGSFSMNVVKLSDYGTLAAMIVAVGSTETTVYIDTPSTLAANTTIPSTMHLVMLRGGSFIKASTYTLTINGQIDAPPVQVFSGFSAGDVTGLTESRPEWFGTNTTPGTTDMATAFASAVSALDDKGKLILCPGQTYSLESAISISSGRNVQIEATGAKIVTNGVNIFEIDNGTDGETIPDFFILTGLEAVNSGSAANAVQGAAHNMRVTDCVLDGYALEFIDNTATSDTDNLAVKVVAERNKLVDPGWYGITCDNFTFARVVGNYVSGATYDALKLSARGGAGGEGGNPLPGPVESSAAFTAGDVSITVTDSSVFEPGMGIIIEDGQSDGPASDATAGINDLLYCTINSITDATHIVVDIAPDQDGSGKKIYRRSEAFILADNILLGSGDGGIDIYNGGRHGIIRGNRIVCPSTATAGIECKSPDDACLGWSEYAIIDGNIISGAPKSILTKGSNYKLINNIIKSPDSGIVISSESWYPDQLNIRNIECINNSIEISGLVADGSGIEASYFVNQSIFAQNNIRIKGDAKCGMYLRTGQDVLVHGNYVGGVLLAGSEGILIRSYEDSVDPQIGISGNHVYYCATGYEIKDDGSAQMYATVTGNIARACTKALTLTSSPVVFGDGNNFGLYQTSATWDPASIANGASETKDVTLTGAALGDYAVASFSLDLTGISITAAVSAANHVDVTLTNNTGGAVNLGSGTVYVRVIKRPLQ